MERVLKSPLAASANPNRCDTSYRVVGADESIANEGGETIDELVVDARVHDDPVRAHADLTLMQEAADNGRPHRMFQVRIVEDNERRVAAELQCDPLELRRLHRKRTDMSAHRRRTRERDQAGNRVRGASSTERKGLPCE